jgi:TPR repeat protein/uncharacterized caspase-like protein
MVGRLATFALAFFTIACAATMAPGSAFADKRVALLIGNGAYVKVPQLTNPANDVAVMKKTLSDAGFDIVDANVNLDRAGMIKALQTFEDAVQDADIGVIFYSGHGMEVNGQNYLIPVDARLASDRVIGDEAIPLDRVLDALDGAKRLKLAILDACRDNPFSASMKRSITRGAPSKGLAKVEPAGIKNVLIAYAAAPGQTALDGEGANSPFTSALAKHLVTPGLDVQLALRKVRDDVGSATGQQQQPYQTGSIGGEILTLSKWSPPQNQSLPRKDETPTLDADASARADFALARQIGTVAMWDEFKRKYPTFYPEAVEAERQKLAAPNKQEAMNRPALPSVLQGAPATECDRLASSPTDPDRLPSTPGIETAQINTKLAIPACRAAEEKYPRERRLSFALGRAFFAAQQYGDALPLMRRAADAGSVAAMTSLGDMYVDGRGVAKDEAEAMRLFRRAADSGNAAAISNLGIMYQDGRGVVQDDLEAIRLYRKAAALGDAGAMNNLGHMYGNGRGVAKDEAEALRLYRKAAGLGDPGAMNSLAWMYSNGRGVAKDEAEAARLYRKAADAGHASAMYHLGVMYENGRGVAQDDAEAIRLYRKAADAGITEAMMNLAWMYENARGVAKDDAAAASLYRKAADAGNIDAVNNLGYMYSSGRGVAKDDVEAARLYRKAADAGSAVAMYNLGSMYADGRGVEHSNAQAKFWYQKAADLGNADAQKALKKLR